MTLELAMLLGAFGSFAFAAGGAWAGVRFALRDLRRESKEHERRLKALERAVFDA